MSKPVYLSLGSNIDRDHNIRSALDELSRLFGSLKISSVYESEAVGFTGDAFLNLIVGIDCKLSLTELASEMKRIEDLHGRARGGKKFASRTLDIDIVCFDRLVGTFSGIELPRPELYYNAFVLFPMAELNPDSPDPKFHVVYRQLARNLESDQILKPINFEWQGRWISTESGSDYQSGYHKQTTDH